MNNYDNESDFTGEIAAKLVAGSNDSATLNQDNFQIVSRGMQQDYQKAFDYYESIGDSDRDDKWQTRTPIPDDALQSLAMQQCERLSHSDRGGTFAGWLTLSPTDFASQRFDRLEIHRWIKAKQIVSAYDFENGSSKVQNTVTPAPVVTARQESTTPPAQSGALPLPTNTIAQLFDGIAFAQKRWVKNIGQTKWLAPANRSKGEQGGAPSTWCPLEIAQLVYAHEKDTRAKQKTLATLNSRFRTNPVLKPWKDEWDDYYGMFTEPGEA